MSENSYILEEMRGQVAVLTLNRPETYNAWRDKDRIAFGEIGVAAARTMPFPPSS